MAKSSIALVLLLALISVAACGHDSHSASTSRRSQELSAREWMWTDEHATAEWCAENQTGPHFHAVLTEGDAEPSESVDCGSGSWTMDSLNISIREGTEERFSWRGSWASVWHVTGDDLYFLDFSPRAAGGWLVSVDLETGHLRWRVPLAGAHLGDHSVWSNRKIIQVRDESLLIWSQDGGRYLETRDRARGEIDTLRKFP